MAVEIKEVLLVDNYIHCRFAGEFEGLKRMIENTRRILTFHRETGCRNALLDFTAMTGRVGIFAEHGLGVQISIAMPKRSRVAVLAPSYMKKKASGHLENVVANRREGFRLFWDHDDAVAWLADPDARPHEPRAEQETQPSDHPKAESERA